MLTVIENVNAAVNNFVFGIFTVFGTVFKLVKEYFKK